MRLAVHRSPDYTFPNVMHAYMKSALAVANWLSLEQTAQASELRRALAAKT